MSNLRVLWVLKVCLMDHNEFSWYLKIPEGHQGVLRDLKQMLRDLKGPQGVIRDLKGS